MDARLHPTFNGVIQSIVAKGEKLSLFWADYAIDDLFLWAFSTGNVGASLAAYCNGAGPGRTPWSQQSSDTWFQPVPSRTSFWGSLLLFQLQSKPSGLISSKTRSRLGFELLGLMKLKGLSATLPCWEKSSDLSTVHYVGNFFSCAIFLNYIYRILLFKEGPLPFFPLQGWYLRA